MIYTFIIYSVIGGLTYLKSLNIHEKYLRKALFAKFITRQIFLKLLTEIRNKNLLVLAIS